MTISFRKMIIDDVDDVFAIEQVCFTIPWSKESFMNEMKTNMLAEYVVAEYEGKTIGYCGMWLVMDEAHITNVAILPDYRGQRFGEKLMCHAMDVARTYEVEVMSLEVRISNLVAQNMYRKLGFQNGGIRKNYYTDNWEDALVMWVKLHE